MSWLIAATSLTRLKELHASCNEQQLACLLMLQSLLTFKITLQLRFKDVRLKVDLPVIGGFLYWALFRCSSTSLGVTQMTCWPFQYFTMLSDCSVLMMSLCVMLVIWLERRGGDECQNQQLWFTGWWHRVLRPPEVFDGQRSPEVPQDLQQDPGPVTSVA